jgi:NADPH:quinone reductase-like Zn-dependent oxidoreductase
MRILCFIRASSFRSKELSMTASFVFLAAMVSFSVALIAVDRLFGKSSAAQASVEQVEARLVMAYMTAWAALVDTAKLEAGETVLITGVTGAVGSAATRIAHLKRANVVGTIRQPTEQRAIADLPINHFVNMADGPLHELVATATAGRGADVVLDVVGGPLFEPCLKSLAHRRGKSPSPARAT